MKDNYADIFQNEDSILKSVWIQRPLRLMIRCRGFVDIRLTPRKNEKMLVPIWTPTLLVDGDFSHQEINSSFPIICFSDKYFAFENKNVEMEWGISKCI